MLKVCPRCRTGNKAEANFCGRCGLDILSEEEKPTQEELEVKLGAEPKRLSREYSPADNRDITYIGVFEDLEYKTIYMGTKHGRIKGRIILAKFGPLEKTRRKGLFRRESFVEEDVIWKIELPKYVLVDNGRIYSSYIVGITAEARKKLGLDIRILLKEIFNPLKADLAEVYKKTFGSPITDYYSPSGYREQPRNYG